MRALKRFILAAALLACASPPSAATTISGKVTVGGVVWVGSAQPFRASFPIAYTTEVNGASATVYTRPLYVPSDVTAVTPYIRNAYSAGGVGSTFSSNVALYRSDGTGAATGSALGTWLAQTIPGDGSDWTGTSTSITRGTDGKIVELESLPAAATTSCSVTPQVHGTYSASTSTVSPPPAPTASDPTPITWNHFDFATTKRRIIVIGDSICAGVNSTTGVEISAWYQLGPVKDYAVSLLCLPGSALGQWAAYTTTSATWWADGRFLGVDVWIQAGVNDVTGSIPSAMETSMTTIVVRLRQLGVNRIYGQTIAPNNATNETTRTGFNTWMRANSLGLTGVADMAAAWASGGVADGSNAAALDSRADSGDHLHWSDAGQNHVAALVQSIVQ